MRAVRRCYGVSTPDKPLISNLLDEMPAATLALGAVADLLAEMTP